MVNPITDEELARLEELHKYATREHGDGTKHLTHSHTVTREFAHALHNAFLALRERLRKAEEENERLIEVCFGSEGIRPDGDIGPTKENWSKWLADRDAKMKAEGAAEWLKANNERLDTMNHADVAMEATALRERAR